MGSDEGYIPDPPSKEDTKFCRKCGEWKPVSHYYRRGRGTKYLAGYCRDCHDKPFRRANITCPHCRGKILCIGVDQQNRPTRQKQSIIKRLKKEAKAREERKKIVPEKTVEEVLDLDDRDLKGMFNDD